MEVTEPSLEHFVDCLREQRGDREHGKLLETLFGGMGSVSVTTTWSMKSCDGSPWLSPEKIAWVQAMVTPRAPAAFKRSAALAIVPPVCSIIDDDAPTVLHLADNLVHRHLIRHQRVAPLVDDRERGAELVAPDVCATRPMSGETTVRSSRSIVFLKCSSSTGIAKR